MNGEQSKERNIAWREIATRCRPTSAVYLFAVPAVISISPKMATAPILPAIFVLCFVVLTWLRRSNAALLAQTPGRIPPELTDRFVLLARSTGMLWGLFSAYAISLNEGWRMSLVLFITVILCAGAISAMTPNFGVFFAYSAAVFLPTNLVLLLSSSEWVVMLGWVSSGLWGFSIWMGWTQNRNYWNQLTTNRRQMEDLQSARERLELVVSGSNLGAFDWIPEEEMIFLDRKVADVLGYPPEMFDPFEGQLEELVFPEELGSLKATIVGHLKDPAAPLCEVEVHLRDSQGEGHWFKFRGRVVQRDDLGRATRMSGTYEDITPRKQAEAALEEMRKRVEQAEKLKILGVLAGGVAHDFNNLLGAFVGNLELADSDLPEGSPVREYLDQAKQSALDASELCNQLLAYAGKGRFVVEKFCLNRLVEEMVQLLRVSVGRNLELEVDLHPDLPCIEGDVSQIRQVVLNLLTNASEAMEGKSGTIRLRTVRCEELLSDSEGIGRPTDCVCLEVLDQGCGMSQETLDKIFDPFFTTKFTGRGLGLASVLGIAHGHGGEIRAKSKLGEGTEFLLLLPAVEAPIKHPEKPAPPAGPGSSSKILVVDDEAAIRRVANLMLSKAGHEVILAEDGVVALEQLNLHDGEISLVLLDLTMPKKDGYETLQELRESWPNLPVVLSSGYSEDAVIEKAQVEVQGFLKKPFTMHQLLGEVHSVCSKETLVP